jgi:hypothetical protein
MRAVIFVAAVLLLNISANAVQFSIVSGDVHAQASLSGVPPTTDTPPDVALNPATPQGSVLAHLSEPVPGGAAGSFSSSAGVSLNSASFSFAGHGDGNGGALLRSVGSGSGSIDLIFNLNAPANVHFLGTLGNGIISPPGFNSSASLSSNGSVITTFPFNNGALDFMQNLGAGTYELSAFASVNAGVNDAGGSETITATIVPEPMAVSIVAAVALCVCRRRFRPARSPCILRT